MAGLKVVEMSLSLLFKHNARCKLCLPHCISTLQGRNYSVYPSSYVKPVYHPAQQKGLDSEDAHELTLKKILPPTQSQNASPFHDVLLEKLVNHVMQGGKKEIARRIIAEAFFKIKCAQIRKYHLTKDPAEQEKISTNPLDIFHRALENCTPVVTVIPIKKGGTYYKVPVNLTPFRATSMAFKWLVETARTPATRHPWSGDHFSDRLAKDLLDASENTGTSIKKKLELHRLCEANKAYAHYRWLR